MAVNQELLANTLLVTFDLGGTFVLALSGDTPAVKHRLDLLGVLVLSFAAGNAGGMARDVLIGAIPPAAISDWRYVAVFIFTGLLTFFWYRIINRLRSPCLCSTPQDSRSLRSPARVRRWLPIAGPLKQSATNVSRSDGQ